MCLLGRSASADPEFFIGVQIFIEGGGGFVNFT